MAPLEFDLAVAILSGDPGSTGVFTDFDGTLSPIVSEPGGARPLDGALRALGVLADSIDEVAIVSGRPASWLANLLRAEGPADGLSRVKLFGLHGLERWDGTRAEPREGARAFAPVVARLRDEAVAAGVPGLIVEDKTYGLTLHWRNASDPESAAREGARLAHELACEGGLLERRGKASIELVPPLGVDKGTVVREEAAGLAVAAFIGDDSGDVRAFVALDDLEASGTRGVRIAVSSPEAPGELLERADLVLGSPEESVVLLTSVASALQDGGR
jgi:trehalose 6-phosphate phosphatase